MSEPRWKKKHQELLFQVDDLCRKYGIQMYLSGTAALSAYRGDGLPDFVEAGINSRDAERFIEAAKQEKLNIKGMFNHYRYDSFDFKVYDPDTIDFDLSTFENNGFYGLYITVKLIYNYPDSDKQTVKGTRMMRAYSEYIAVKYGRRWKASHRRLAFYNVLGSVLPPDRFSKMMFNRLSRLYGGKTEFVGIKGHRFPASLFEETQSVSLCGREFKIPKDAETFFEIYYGINWKNQKIPTYSPDGHQFRDADRSWDEFLKYIDYLDLDEFKENIAVMAEYAKDYIEYNRQVTYNTNLMIRTHLRFILWQRYYPIKKDLIRLREEENYDELYRILFKYILVLEKCVNKKITVCFDPEIFRLTMDTLRAKGQDKLADDSENLVPPEHLNEVIRIKNYEGEYI